MAQVTDLRVFSVRNADRNTMLATHARLYSSFAQRFMGLMMRKSVEPGGGILLTKSSSIHSFFMRFRFDAVFIDDSGRVTKVATAMRPWWATFGGKGGKHTLELPAHAADGTQRGDQLLFEPPTA